MIEQSKIDSARTQFKKCAITFIALGDHARQNICLNLATSQDGLNVKQLTELSNLSRPAISHHLKVLKDCNLIEANKKGTQIFYQLSLKDCFLEIKQLVALVDEILKHKSDTN